MRYISQESSMERPESSAMRKRRELMELNKTDDESFVVKSPYLNDVTTNPCIREQNQSMKCTIDFLHDKEVACKEAFENYVICRKFWYYVEKDRSFKGISPKLPLPEDREKVKEEYKDELRAMVKKTLRRG